MTIITLNKKTKAGKTLYDFAQNLAIKNKGIVIDDTITKKQDTLTKKQLQWVNGLKKSIDEAKEVAAGTMKGQSLQSFLDEL